MAGVCRCAGVRRTGAGVCWPYAVRVSRERCSACLLAFLFAADVFAGFFAQGFFGRFFRGVLFRAEEDSPEEVQREELEEDHRDGVAVARPDVDDVDMCCLLRCLFCFRGE